jgi:hypothetical protein
MNKPVSRRQFRPRAGNPEVATASPFHFYSSGALSHLFHLSAERIPVGTVGQGSAMRSKEWSVHGYSQKAVGDFRAG